MNKKNIIIIISLIGVLGIIGIIILSRQNSNINEEEQINQPNMERLNKETGEYEYSSEEIKKLSEEANINLEIGNVEVEEKIYFGKEEKEYITSTLDPLYRGEIIKNTENTQEWIIKVIIPMEVEGEYRLWKLNIDSNTPEQSYKEIGKLENTAYEEYELKITDQELKGNYIIAKLNKDNNLPDNIIYTIDK